MFDVNDLVNDSFETPTYFSILEAYVTLSALQDSVRKGELNTFGRMLDKARVTYVKFKELAEKGGWNNPELPWHEAAATEIRSEAIQAISEGKLRNFNEKYMRTYENAVGTICSSIEEGADILETVPGSGEYVLGSKNKLEQWRKDRKAKAAQDRHEANMAALRAAGMAPEDATDKGQDEAETDGDTSFLDGLPESTVSLIREIAELAHSFQDYGNLSVEVPDISDPNKAVTAKAEAVLDAVLRNVCKELRQKWRKPFADTLAAFQRQAANG